KITATHLLDLEFGDPLAAVLPGDGNDGPGVSPDNGLERNLNREVKMRREQRPAAIDDRTAIGFESIGCIIERDVKEHLDEKVGQAVDEKFQPGIINDVPSADKAAAKNAFPALVQQAPVTDGILGRVGGVGHHDRAGVAAHPVETANNGVAKAKWTGILHRHKRGDLPAQMLENGPSIIPAAI